MKCGKCGINNPINVNRCIYCGASLAQPVKKSIINRANGAKASKNRKTDNIIIGAIIALAAVFVIIAGVYAYNSMPKRSGFSGGGGGGGGGAVIASSGGVDSSGAFSLEASKNELEVGTSDRVIYFYAMPKGNVTTVELTDNEGNVVAQMRDDGLYSESGDDLQNDGIYTAKIQQDVAQEKTYYYSAIINSNKGYKSNTVKVSVIALLTDEELNAIEKVENVLDGLRNSDVYKGYSVDERRVAMLEKINGFKEEGVILPNSVYDDKQNNIITFCYSFGVLAVEELEDASILENGFGGENKNYNEQQYANSSGNIADIDDVDVGKAKILYATDNTKSDRYTMIKSLKSGWNEQGLETDVDTDVTIEDMKALKGYDFVCVDAHGGYVTFVYEYDKEYTWYFKKIASKNTTVQTSGVLLREKTTRKKDRQYSLGLKSGRILHWGGNYGIAPDFFRQYYNSTDLEDAIFMWTCCEFMGKDNNVREEWTEVMNSRNVAAFVGYHNSVYGFYAYQMVDVIAKNLINGDTIQSAYNKSIIECGADDAIWFNNQTWETSWYKELLKKVFGGEEPTAHSPAAYPLLRGDQNATLVNLSLKNGNFEADSSSIKNWKKTGDVRLISKLGAVSPREGSFMSILTTGIGSGQSTYLNSTEGSSLYQTFKVPDNKTTVSFDYNIISEEPMEYVGSQFDDKFYAEILNPGGEVIKTLACETVNNSEWSEVDGINFEDGDDTVYQTGWKKVNADISDLRGQIVTIRFVVFDVGDSMYDTAAVVDNVALK